MADDPWDKVATDADQQPAAAAQTAPVDWGNAAVDAPAPQVTVADPTTQPDYAQRVQADWDKSNAAYKADLARNAAGGQSDVLTNLDTMGTMAGQAMAPVNEAYKSATNYASQASNYADSQIPGISTILGNAINPARGLLTQAMSSAPAQAGKGLLAQAAANHPLTADAIQQVGNIGSILGAGEGLLSKGALGETAPSVLKQPIDYTNIPEQDFANKLVMPIQTKKVATQQALNSVETGGLLNKTVPIPSSQEKAAIEAVRQIPGVSSSNTYQGNLNLIKDANSAEAENLKGLLQNSKGAISDNDVSQMFNTAKSNLADNAYITGDGETAANKIINLGNKAIAKYPKTPLGMLQARQHFDTLIPARVFDAAVDTPITEAVREVRQGMNGLIGKAAPEANVQQSLAKQSALYHAVDNIAPKAAGQANNRITRVVQQGNNLLKNQVVRTGALIGGLK